MLEAVGGTTVFGGEKWAKTQRPRAEAHLTDIVEVPVWHFLLSSQLLHLIEQNVHLELGAQVLKTAVAE